MSCVIDWFMEAQGNEQIEAENYLFVVHSSCWFRSRTVSCPESDELRVHATKAMAMIENTFPYSQTCSLIYFNLHRWNFSFYAVGSFCFDTWDEEIFTSWQAFDLFLLSFWEIRATWNSRNSIYRIYKYGAETQYGEWYIQKIIINSCFYAGCFSTKMADTFPPFWIFSDCRWHLHIRCKEKGRARLSHGIACEQLPECGRQLWQ